MRKHLGHLKKVFKLFVDNGVIISKKEMKLCKIVLIF